MINTKIIEMADPRVRSISIVDCGEPLVDIASGRQIAYGPPPECPETESFYRLLREGVVRRLEKAQNRLPAGLKFRLYEGYRNPQVQKMLFDEQLQRMTKEHSTRDLEWCYAEAAKLASPLQTFEGTPIVPPHSTGGAIDIEIMDDAGSPLDFGMDLRDWNVVPPELCATEFSDLPGAVINNRKLLLKVLTAEGFVNYPREWWHFSYGDQYWAFASANSQALYGSTQIA